MTTMRRRWWWWWYCLLIIHTNLYTYTYIFIFFFLLAIQFDLGGDVSWCEWEWNQALFSISSDAKYQPKRIKWAYSPFYELSISIHYNYNDYHFTSTSIAQQIFFPFHLYLSWKTEKRLPRTCCHCRIFPCSSSTIEFLIHDSLFFSFFFAITFYLNNDMEYIRVRVYTSMYSIYIYMHVIVFIVFSFLSTTDSFRLGSHIKHFALCTIEMFPIVLHEIAAWLTHHTHTCIYT